MSINVLSNRKIDELYELKELDIDGDRLLAIMSSNSFQSLSYIEEEKMFDIYDSYPQLYDILSNLGDVNSILVLGGGGFTYPKYYISKYPEKTMDVIEINKKLIDITFQYLYLDKLYELYDPMHNRLKIMCMDAYDYIVSTNKKYDGIFIDLYIDNDPLNIIYKENFIFNIKKILNNGKFVSINYILHKNNLKLFYEFNELLLKYFANIKIVTTEYNLNLDDKNLYILCSDSNINIPNNFTYVEFNI